MSTTAPPRTIGRCCGMRQVLPTRAWSTSSTRLERITSRYSGTPRGPDEGRYDDARPNYDELVRRNEADTRARLMRGVTAERTGKDSEALTDYGGQVVRAVIPLDGGGFLAVGRGTRGGHHDDADLWIGTPAA